MICLKCGAANNDEDIFCTNCGAVLVGVSLDDPDTVAAAPKPAYCQPASQPAYAYQPAPEQADPQPICPAKPAHTAQASPEQPIRRVQQRPRRRRSPYPQGIEWLPFGGAVAAFLCLLLPWFSVGKGLEKFSVFGLLFDFLGDLGNLGFLVFMCIGLYLVLIVSPLMIAYFTWRRDNNYMGLSMVAIAAAILAELFTWLAFKNLLSKATNGAFSGVGYGIQIGFFLYVLAVGVVIAGGVILSMQRQKRLRRPRPTQTA